MYPILLQSSRVVRLLLLLVVSTRLVSRWMEGEPPKRGEVTEDSNVMVSSGKGFAATVKISIDWDDGVRD